MKRLSYLFYSTFIAFLILVPSSCTPEMVENVAKVSEVVLTGGQGVSQSGDLSTLDVVKGLKSALAVGSSNAAKNLNVKGCLLYTSPSPRDRG